MKNSRAKRFCKQINILMRRRTGWSLKNIGLYFFSNKMTIQFNMLGFVVNYRISCNMESSILVLTKKLKGEDVVDEDHKVRIEAK